MWQRAKELNKVFREQPGFAGTGAGVKGGPALHGGASCNSGNGINNIHFRCVRAITCYMLIFHKLQGSCLRSQVDLAHLYYKLNVKVFNRLEECGSFSVPYLDLDEIDNGV